MKRSEQRTLGISVTPDDEVIVTAPEYAEQEHIDERRQKRAVLIRQTGFVSNLPRAIPAHQFLPGETHLFLGRQYKLKVDQDQLGTERRYGRIIVGRVPADQPTRIRNRLRRWYQREAVTIFGKRLGSCWKKIQNTHARPNLKFSSMERHWCRYLRQSHSVMLNYQLVQTPVQLIDYVIMGWRFCTD